MGDRIDLIQKGITTWRSILRERVAHIRSDRIDLIQKGITTIRIKEHISIEHILDRIDLIQKGITTFSFSIYRKDKSIRG